MAKQYSMYIYINTTTSLSIQLLMMVAVSISWPLLTPAQHTADSPSRFIFISFG